MTNVNNSDLNQLIRHMAQQNVAGQLGQAGAGQAAVGLSYSSAVISSALPTEAPTVPTGPVRLPNGRFAPKPGSKPRPSRSKKKGLFDTVILDAEKKQQILDAIQQVDHHDLIFKEWGFADVFEKGTAISLLFYGQPGTGKTLMAQAIAQRYERRLTIIGSAEIETPEPGGAERNLKKAFERAAEENAVLLFDECDSLITDRQRVGMILSAQINCLLTELEKYTGIVIFTTNRLGDLDPAFDRRVSLKLEFPMPTPELRVKIWQRMFPKKAPVAKDVRWEDLGQIEIAGGHIKNVVLRAARAAASKGLKEITDEVIWDALEAEVSSSTAFNKAIDRSGWYGTPLHQGAQMDLRRAMAKRTL